MTNAEKIIKIANENNGYVTTKQVKDANINTVELTRLVEQNKLERITRGYYAITNSFCDDYYKYQLKSKNCIFSHSSFTSFSLLINPTAIDVHTINAIFKLFSTKLISKDCLYKTAIIKRIITLALKSFFADNFFQILNNINPKEIISNNPPSAISVTYKLWKDMFPLTNWPILSKPVPNTIFEKSVNWPYTRFHNISLPLKNLDSVYLIANISNVYLYLLVANQVYSIGKRFKRT